LVGGRSGADHGTVERRRGAGIAQGGQVIGLHDERAQIARLERERAIDRGARRRVVLESGAGIGEAEVGGGIRLAGRDDPFEGFARLAGVALAQGLDAVRARLAWGEVQARSPAYFTR